ncbi:hypothetical protein Poli38472_004228 [Pythium oligandrum]|uniref:Uncharacterized protein n=1 Tax=Pythium oligandrum TaxID=41045 RepID=A0A8K1FQC3_PYTOL|nr:hypothetical protein Poli38472_004228 [Pythium oligandrum]|eukprot:TMW66463.1 hypothetical protein Poli38472_004228 [Pythium oligandrum]
MESEAKDASTKVLVKPLGPRSSLTTTSYSGAAKVGKCPTPWQLVHLIRRILGLAAAIFFVYSTIESGVYGLYTLYGATRCDDNYGGYQADFITQYLGTKSIRESPLFTQVLGDDSTLRQDTVYLQSPDRATFTECDGMSEMNKWLYGNEFLRSNWHDLVSQTSYNLTFLEESELIAPVVDCSFSAIAMGDITSTRVFYLMRKQANPANVFIIIASFSTQDYSVPDQFQVGASIYVSLEVLNDMRATSLQHALVLAMGYPFEGPYYSVYILQDFTDNGFIILENVPEDPTTNFKRRVHTSNRSGFYLKSEQSQSNIQNLRWTLYDDPVMALTTWRWSGCTVVLNAWGWVRCIHFVFAINTTFNLCVLMMVVYRNFQRRKIWIGDAFISISNSLQLRGASVLAVWAMENFWQLTVFTLHYGSTQGNISNFFTHPAIMHGDLMVLYVALAGFLGTILNERIDPTLTILLYELGFNGLETIGNWFPALRDLAIRFAIDDFMSGITNISFALNSFSPFGFWAIHRLVRNAPASLATVALIFMTFVFIVIYAVVRKAYRRVYPSRAIAYSSRITKGSSNLSEGKGMKSPFTLFELATGAELQNRVGLVSDYDNCVFIKGIRYASADGIYCNGFVIANGQWLIRTADLWSVVLIIMTGTRLRDVYVYEVKDHKVSQMAKLVYPNTLTFMDLTKLNTTVLA